MIQRPEPRNPTQSRRRVLIGSCNALRLLQPGVVRQLAGLLRTSPSKHALTFPFQAVISIEQEVSNGADACSENYQENQRRHTDRDHERELRSLLRLDRALQKRVSRSAGRIRAGP